MVFNATFNNISVISGQSVLLVEDTRVPPVQSVPITTKVVSSNPAHAEVYSIQLYAMKFVTDVRQVGGFLRVLWCPPPIKRIVLI
jgi:hypothetical protein